MHTIIHTYTHTHTYIHTYIKIHTYINAFYIPRHPPTKLRKTDRTIFYLWLFVPSRHVAPHIPSRHVAPHIPSRNVTPHIPSRHVAPHIPSRHVTPHIPSRHVTPHILNPCSKCSYVLVSRPAVFTHPMPSGRDVGRPSK